MSLDVRGDTADPVTPPGLKGTLRVAGSAVSKAAILGTREETRKRELAGTHRVCTLEDTLPKAMAAARTAGMSRLADLTGLDSLGIPAFSSIRPGAAEGAITVTGGKGTTPISARISALLEAVERYCGERNGRFGPYLSLARARARAKTLDPRALILDVASPWNEDCAIEWWPTRDLFAGDEVLVPAGAILFPYELPPDLFDPHTNGLASGNSLPEATLHALLEIIERDATALGEATMSAPQLDLDSARDTELQWLIDRFRQADIELHVRVFCEPTGIPTFQVTADDVARKDPMLINGGYGCHLNPQVGLSRALTEAALSRVTLISGSREDLAVFDGARSKGYERIKSEFPKWFSKEERRIKLSDLPDRSTDSITGDLAVVLDAMSRSGFRQALVADLSLPDVGFAVARAVVPGAEMPHKSPTLKRVGPRLFRKLKEAVR